MADEITPELFAHLVDLAALALAPAEAEYLRQQLNGQLKAVRELESIPVGEDVPPAAHGVPYPAGIRPRLRADESERDLALAARIVGQAPESEDGYFVVPDIPHNEI
jgi:aspartyl/glutamyl-tRNA(Asn/Gln) amidotransferase C subunit